jgi:hypothetical protein
MLVFLERRPMLTAAEYLMREPLPLYRVHETIFDFCRGRTDLTIFGAQAVNIYVPEPRMTQDVDLFSPVPSETAEALAAALKAAFGIAIRIRQIAGGKAYRIYQLRNEGNRHLADVRLREFSLEDSTEREGIRYVSLPLMIAMKAAALSKRKLAPKGATDLADVRRLLLAHPELRSAEGPVADAIRRIGGGPEVFQAWEELRNEPAVADDDDYA